MICTCQSCHGPFWRYRRDWPPPGFCSLPCLQAGPRKAIEHTERPPYPEEVLAAMREHRWQIHRTHSMLTQYECQRCEDLEEYYAESITYHLSRVNADIVADAERRRLSPRVSHA